ncbi:uncharacterized protein BXZ73DRAFT_39580 [Epithele typhae]|uniref:uncharacterized protein n=1 Tax=Epithele typhae TaxID=378194 RepID=UPI00200846DF|nr:uncharacterized protein BXZ73DRAFT_39580 [Epithele typhae]KAH9944135.1 hypothetical protein BXZ73DRAFT_39580 [Epithele typhae]
MRTIMPFASNSLAIPMSSTQTAEAREHAPTSLNSQELSRSASPQQSNLSLLVCAFPHLSRHPSMSPGNPPPSHPEPSLSIQSILSSAPPSGAPTNGECSYRDAIDAFSRDNDPVLAGSSSMAPPPPPQRSSTKRKLDGPDIADPHNKIRRVVREHITQDPSRVMPMTTVICLHAAVAQKSYGSEKRFLCPPPIVHIEGPVWQMKHQHLSMSVVNEGGERTCELKAPMDHNLTASFKFLHVTGSAKSKSFQLSLDIAESVTHTPEGGDGGARERVWASFDSAPVTIISKPSKKTAKTRNISSCILAGGPVSLFNRINSQTVRTKYMTIEHNQLCASNVAWSAFAVNVVRPQGSENPLGGPQPVTYGSEIVLADTVTGVQTAPLIIRKVDKGRIVPDDGGPVSQMQKIALQRVNNDGTRHYLSAAGPIPGTPGISAPPAPGLSNQAGTHPLLFQSPRIREEMKDGTRVITDEVDDYLCWTIVGISKFQYTFFDAFGLNNNVPEMPITPFPTLFNSPVYRSQHNFLEMMAANFFYTDPKTKEQTPLDVYVGNLGPLRLRIYNHSPLAMDGRFDPSMPFVPIPNLSHEPPNTPIFDERIQPGNQRNDMVLNLPARHLHMMIVVELPSMRDILQAIQDDAIPDPTGDPGKQRTPRDKNELGFDTFGRDVAGRSLPLLFIRSYDGVGYHSGRVIAAENVLHNMEMSPRPPGEVGEEWLAAAREAADMAPHNGWSLKVL